jgi:tripartite-type tricarboxylate transporter receptor subunit TctC
MRIAVPREPDDRLFECLRNALLDAEIRPKLIDMGLEPSPMPPAEFGCFIVAEIAKWTEVGQAAGISL